MLIILVMSLIVSFHAVVDSESNDWDSNEFPQKAGAEENLPKQPRGDIELSSLVFTPAATNDCGIQYICRRGVETVAFFGTSEVFYRIGNYNLKIEFPQSNRAEPVGEERTGSITNYMFGNDPNQWQTGLMDCTKIRYSEIYPGIDLVYSTCSGDLKYEFIIRPNANPNDIRIRYPDADRIDICDDCVSVSKNDLFFSDVGLYAFQKDTEINDIDCVFATDSLNTIRFNIGNYIKSRELVIDPYILYSTYVGGGSNYDEGWGIAVDDGYAYITGFTSSTDFPTSNAMNTTSNGGDDCFVFKLGTNGRTLIYSTFLGGTSDDYGYSIDIEDGFVYLLGSTWSSDFPTINAYDPSYNSAGDCFLTKISPDGQTLLYSTYFGGSGVDIGYDMVVDSGCAHIAGYTDSSNLPLGTNWYDSIYNGGTYDGFVAKFSSDGQSLPYTTYYGGNAGDYLYGVAVEGIYVYIAGTTFSANFPVLSAYDMYLNGSSDCFLAKLPTTGGTMIYSTYLGGTNGEDGFGLAVEDGYAYITGMTTSTDFPFISEYSSSLQGISDCFVTKVATNGQSLIYSTYLGGSSVENGFDIDVDNGYAYITGYTNSPDFPTENACDSTHNGFFDTFVTKLNNDGTLLVYSTFLGGAQDEFVYGLDFEKGKAFVTGFTGSADYPICSAFDATLNGTEDCFVSCIIEDADMDGLSDWEEAEYGTNPYCVDSDNDGFLDAYEVAYGSDPCDANSYPAMPETWYDAIYTNLNGNATLIQYLIDWSDGNSTLLESLGEQLDRNSTLLIQVISWLDGNHTAIETLFTYLDGNATLLEMTVSELDGNATLIEDLLDWFDEIDALVDILYTNLEGNATLLLDIMSSVEDNSAELDLLSALIAQDVTRLTTFNASYVEDMDEIREILDQLGISVGDSDCDGLDDLDEIYYGTDLLCVDTDQDNLLDSFEIKLGTDPLDDDSDADTYLDGLEVLKGSDPLDPLSFPGSEQGIDPVLVIVAISGIGAVAIIIVVFAIRARRRP